MRDAQNVTSGDLLSSKAPYFTRPHFNLPVTTHKSTRPTTVQKPPCANPAERNAQTDRNSSKHILVKVVGFHKVLPHELNFGRQVDYFRESFENRVPQTIDRYYPGGSASFAWAFFIRFSW